MIFGIFWQLIKKISSQWRDQNMRDGIRGIYRYPVARRAKQSIALPDRKRRPTGQFFTLKEGGGQLPVEDMGSLLRIWPKDGYLSCSRIYAGSLKARASLK